MTTRLPSPLALVAAGALALSALFTLSRATAQPGVTAPPAPPTSIAIIDLEKILDQCNEGKDERARLKATDEANQKELDGINNKLKEFRTQLEAMSKDDPQRREIEAQANALAARGKVIMQDMQRDAQKAYGATMWKLYSKINDAVNRYGAENGLDAILVYDELKSPKDPENVPPQAVQAISQGRSVMYRSPRIDITANIVLKLNTEYAAAGGKPAAAVPPAPAPVNAGATKPTNPPAAQPKGAPKKKGG
jgi:Skp family chaperone for outer membrane proteins